MEVTLDVPSGRSTLSESVVYLEDTLFSWTTVTLTPQTVSELDDDVVLLAYFAKEQVGEGKATNAEKVQIITNEVVGKIRAANTPTGMLDRIPPRVPALST